MSVNRTLCSATFFAAIIGLAVTMPSVAHAQIFRAINFADNPGPATISAEGVEVTLQPKGDGDGVLDVVAAIRIPGYQSIIVTEESGSSAGFDRWVGIGKLSKSDAAPSVLLQGYTGGAHCCASLQVITPYAGRLKVLRFEGIDGEGPRSFPRDIDGDGTVEFERQDDRFRYQFASGAGSYSPPLMFNIYKGQIVDVSAEPAFRPIWEKFAAETRSRCADRSNSDRNGACAAYVVAGVRLGRFEIVMAEADRLAYQKPGVPVLEGCAVELVDYTCPPTKAVKFYSFKSAIAWFLKQTGYIE